MSDPTPADKTSAMDTHDKSSYSANLAKVEKTISKNAANRDVLKMMELQEQAAF